MFVLYRRRSYFICVARNKKNERSTKENPPPSATRLSPAVGASDCSDLCIRRGNYKTVRRNKRYRGDRQTTEKCGVFKASRLLVETCHQQPAAPPANHAFMSLRLIKCCTPACVTNSTTVSYNLISIISLPTSFTKTSNVTFVFCEWYESFCELCSHRGGRIQTMIMPRIFVK